MSAITNGLVDAANKAVAGNCEEALLQVSSMRLKHEVTAKALFPTQTRFRAVMNEIELTFCQLEILLKGISYVGELSPRSLDAVSGFGEMLSSRLFAEFASDFKMNCVWFDARKVITTDNDFGKASPLWDVIANKASAEIKPLLAAGKVVITQGFIGATDKGVPTTLARPPAEVRHFIRCTRLVHRLFF